VRRDCRLGERLEFGQHLAGVPSTQPLVTWFLMIPGQWSGISQSESMTTRVASINLQDLGTMQFR